MPDLGDYAFEVSLAYIGSIALLVGIVLLSWRQARRSRRQLEDIERRHNG
jgi:heme exporter protein CcmD